MFRSLLLIITAIFCHNILFAQTPIWTETFDPIELPGWTLNSSIGLNDPDANFWQISDDEGGVLPGGCGVGFNGNRTLHLTNALQFATGAAYDAGGLCGILNYCITTNTASNTPDISTIGVTAPLTLNFDYIEEGDGTDDDFFIRYSTNGGATWLPLSNPNKTLNAACIGQGLWTSYSIPLPIACNNISNLKISFCWTNNDDGVGTDPSTAINDISITIPSVTNTQPVALSDSLYLPCNDTVVVNPLLNDIDVDAGQTLSIGNAGVSPLQGVLNVVGNSITFIPNPTFTGIAYIAYTACDNGLPSLCDTSYIAININALCSNNPPIIVPDTITVPCGVTTFTFNPIANDVDPDAGQTLSLTSFGVVPAASVTLTVVGNVFSVTAASSFCGSALVTYTICDNGLPTLCSTATLSINICACPNITPIAVNDTLTTVCNTPIFFNSTVNDIEVDALQTINVTSLGTIPTSIGTFVQGGNTSTFTPAPGYTGSFSTTYTICDNGSPVLCDTGVIYITVLNQGCNTPPIANNDIVNTICNTAITFNPIANDVDTNAGQTLSLTTIGNVSPLNGTLSVIGNNVTFTPAISYFGSFNITYVVCDNGLPSLCDTGFINVTVLSTGCNQPPIALNDIVNMPCFGTSTVNILSNDTEPDTGQVLTFNILKTSTKGTYTISANGTITYTHTTCTLQKDTIEYSICDNGIPVYCDTALVIFTINGCDCNNPPNALPDVVTTNCNTVFTITPLSNDIDTNVGQTMVLTSIIYGSLHGTSVVSNNNIIYTPNSCYSGGDTIVYVVCDNGIPVKCDTGVVLVSVGICNCIPPVANFTANKFKICAGDCINFTDQSTNTPTSWIWGFPGATPSSSALQNPTTICYNTPGLYNVTLIATNAYGSSTQNKINYIEVVPNIPTQTVNIIDTLGKTITLVGNIAPAITSYTWTPSAGLNSTTIANPSFYFSTNTSYNCTVTDANGCTGSVFYNYTGIPGYFDKNYVWVPNAFTPNNDGINDGLVIKHANVKEFNIVIYDKWGNKVYESTDPKQQWNGSINNWGSTINVYMYYLKATFTNGETISKQGDVIVYN